MQPLTIRLPWPNKVLSPNARAHWRQVARAKKSARYSAMMLTREALGRAEKPAGSPLSVSLTFQPPDLRGRDQDNAQASLKAALDGIADALGVDDNLFRLAAPVWGEPCRPDGAVIVVVGSL